MINKYKLLLNSIYFCSIKIPFIEPDYATNEMSSGELNWQRVSDHAFLNKGCSESHCALTVRVSANQVSVRVNALRLALTLT